ncbi:MAG: S41 family peptidase [Segetibacter sp.]
MANYFKEYFSFLFGYPATFSIRYKLGNSDQQTANINGLSKDSIRIYRQAKYSNRVSLTREKQGIVLEMNKQSSIAILCIKSFDNDILNSVYKQDFNSTVQRMFIQINNANIRNLVLDIRNNQGGDFETGKLLLSYLLRQPVKYLPDRKEYEIIIPKKNSFKGNLFIIINGGSFSSTGILSSYLEFTKRGVFIGEETAGNKVLISGDPIDIALPNTKILSELSTIKYVIRKTNNDGHGVIPTYYMTSSIDNIIIDKDITKEFVLSLISKNKQ